MPRIPVHSVHTAPEPSRDGTELSVHVTLNLFTNYFNHYVKTDLDLPAAPPL